jgi:hypothetical protein
VEDRMSHVLLIVAVLLGLGSIIGGMAHVTRMADLEIKGKSVQRRERTLCVSVEDRYKIITTGTYQILDPNTNKKMMVVEDTKTGMQYLCVMEE